MSGDKHNSKNPFEFTHDEPVKPVDNINQPESKITLVPINFIREPIKQTGDAISLNRALIDENDKSLSRDTHLKFIRKDGRWFIENSSSNQSTFVQVTEPVEIKSGTLISVGENKILKFFPQ